jgi:hypothetical protein
LSNELTVSDGALDPPDDEEVVGVLDAGAVLLWLEPHAESNSAAAAEDASNAAGLLLMFTGTSFACAAPPKRGQLANRSSGTLIAYLLTLHEHPP